LVELYGVGSALVLQQKEIALRITDYAFQIRFG
jgi:hypothetical protein